MIENIKCRALFATHYHMLLKEFQNFDGISFYNMKSTYNSDDETVTFLYKLEEGQCEKSFGINVAKTVGINNMIIERATEKEEKFQQIFN